MSVVIVLDPGHGSEEFHGGEFGPYIEKEIDLSVAKALKTRLEMYDDVEVYLTRENDINVGLKERADFAKAKNADYFFSIHFNLSSAHDYYGSEVWLSINRNSYIQMYPMASELMKNFDSIGLYNRGIKTRPGEHGNYYAVIRYCESYGIPSCIIEHCHMDNIRDTIFLPLKNNKVSEESLLFFGNSDADAIARGLKLKSTALGIDYSNFKVDKVNIKKATILPDEKAPFNCVLTVKSFDSSTNTVTLNIHAESDSYLLYYRVSTDGGLSFSSLQDWPRTSWNNSLNDCEIKVNISQIKGSGICAQILNSYDVESVTGLLSLDEIKKFQRTETVNRAIDNSVLDKENSLSTANVEIVENLTKSEPQTLMDNAAFRYGALGVCIVLFGVVIGMLVGLLSRKPKTRKVKRDD